MPFNLIYGIWFLIGWSLNEHGKCSAWWFLVVEITSSSKLIQFSFSSYCYSLSWSMVMIACQKLQMAFAIKYKTINLIRAVIWGCFLNLIVFWINSDVDSMLFCSNSELLTLYRCIFTTWSKIKVKKWNGNWSTDGFAHKFDHKRIFCHEKPRANKSRHSCLGLDNSNAISSICEKFFRFTLSVLVCYDVASKRSKYPNPIDLK